MQAWTDWTSSTHSRRWRRRKKTNAVARAWAWFLGSLVGMAATAVLVWQIEDRVHSSVANGSTMGEAALSVIRGSEVSPWEQDVLDSLEMSAQQVGMGEIAQAEIGVDKIAGLLTTARLNAQRSEPAFFQMAITGMDRVWSQRPDDSRLFQHVTQARIELATLRVAQNVPPPANSTGGNAAAGPAPAPASGADANAGAPGARRVLIRAPRGIAANFTLNPGDLGGNYLDATQMPATAEILLPPAQGSFDDNVRVENLTIAGASQTLDAIRWANVTFVRTRLRYEKGPVDLENVHFVGCTFGFPADETGSRLATAIALGQTSFVAD